VSPDGDADSGGEKAMSPRSLTPVEARAKEKWAHRRCCAAPLAGKTLESQASAYDTAPAARAAVGHSALLVARCTHPNEPALQVVALHCRSLHCIASRCTALQVVALHCKSLHCIAGYCRSLQRIANRCRSLQRIANRCRSLQRIASHCRSLQVIAGRCNALQVVATHCKSLQASRLTTENAADFPAYSPVLQSPHKT
jgi:hypothetical protein